jgi:hypothetical protein
MEGTDNNNKRQSEIQGAQNELSSLVLFNQNTHFAYIHKKTEKLVTAVYMITNFIKDTEPLKWKIRENSLKLMQRNISFNTVSLSDRRDLIKEYQALSIEIVSLSSIAYHSGLISEMNFLVLSREFTALVSLIEKDENRKANEETVMLHPGFFEVSRKALESQKDSMIQNQMRTPETEIQVKGQAASQVPAIDVSRAGDRKPEYLNNKDAKEKVSKPADAKDSRQAIILKLLAKKSNLNIKDFADSIKGVSAKTIQRELLSMVAAGVLRKEGERRWSTYSLNK